MCASYFDEDEFGMFAVELDLDPQNVVVHVRNLSTLKSSEDSIVSTRDQARDARSDGAHTYHSLFTETLRESETPTPTHTFASPSFFRFPTTEVQSPEDRVADLERSMIVALPYRGTNIKSSADAPFTDSGFFFSIATGSNSDSGPGTCVPTNHVMGLRILRDMINLPDFAILPTLHLLLLLTRKGVGTIFSVESGLRYYP